MPSPAPPSRGLLPPLAKPKPALPAAKTLLRGHAQVQARARAQPVAQARSSRPDDVLSAGFVRLLNAAHVQDAASNGRTGELYDPKPGDFVVGVVVSGTEARLDVAVGADRLAVMLAKELLPLDRGGADRLEQETPPRPGSMGVVASPTMSEEEVWKQKHGSRALVAPGTVVFAEVLGRTLSGRPLLSARRLFRRLAWHRARQIMQLDEPIEVKIYEWNTGGLLTKIEGLRAFLPKFELMDRMSTFTDLKTKVGCSIRVCIVKLDEETNDLIISEKKAWVGTLTCPRQLFV